jgi:thioesterase domain-containing protein
MLKSEPAGIAETASDASVLPVSEQFVFPTTVAQRGFWFLDRLNPGNPAYNIAVRFWLDGPVDVGILRRAFNRMIRRHESLRTAFAEAGGEPVQVISPNLVIDVPVVDLLAIPTERRAAEADKAAREEARRPFDLTALPLMRASLLRVERQRYMLLVTIHHIVADGWSIGVISDELCAHCTASSRESDPSPELPIQYGDFAVWQQEWFQHADIGSQLTYWKQNLAGLTELNILTDRPRKEEASSQGQIESILLPRELTDGLRDFSKRETSTMFMTSLAALKILMHRYSGQTDICLGSVVAGRTRVETEALIGLFVNPIVLRTDLSGDPVFPDLLARVRETVLGALANQDIPFQRLIEELRPKRDPSRHPLFQVNFIYQRDFVRPVEFSGIKLTPVPSKSPGSIYDLNFFMVERSDGWRASCEYDTELFEQATVQRMLRQFQALLEGIVGDPSRRISRLPLLTGDEQRHVFELPASRNDQRRNALATDLVYVPPRDEIETRLTGIWQGLLGVERISVTADFFDSGGHSLLAGTLLSQAERAFGKKLRLPAFLQRPTIESLASQIRDSQVSGHAVLASVIHPNGSKLPLIVLGGPEYRALVGRLGPEQPVLGLPKPDFEDLPSPLRIEDIAAHLTDTLLRIRPRGPYLLAGFCNTGQVVYEMARQLDAKGHDVPLVVLLDTTNVCYARKFRGLKFSRARAYFFVQRLRYHFTELRNRDLSKAAGYLGDRAASILRRWTGPWRRLPAWKDRSRSPSARTSSELLEQAVKRYNPQPYSGTMVVFRTRAMQTGRYRDLNLGWGEFAQGGLTVYEIPGTHDELLLEPRVASVASYLMAHLEAAANETN